MIYFKHYTDSTRGQSIQGLLNEFGHTGLIYWVLVELCAEKLAYDSERGVTEDDCLFRFSERIVRQNLRISRTNLRKFLDKCQTFSLLTWNLVGDELEIKMPKLLDYLSYDQKKARHKTATPKDSRGRDIDKDKDKDKDIGGGGKAVFDFESLYKTYPKKSGKARGMAVLSKTIKTDEDYQLLFLAVKNFCDNFKNTDPQFVPYFSTFVGTEKIQAWRDYIEPVEKKEVKKIIRLPKASEQDDWGDVQ